MHVTVEAFFQQAAQRGYEVAVHGEMQWNGVAILSRVGLDDVVAGVAGAPGFPRPEARAVSGLE
jgi:exodeoxyribonuclease-3